MAIISWNDLMRLELWRRKCELVKEKCYNKCRITGAVQDLRPHLKPHGWLLCWTFYAELAHPLAWVGDSRRFRELSCKHFNLGHPILEASPVVHENGRITCRFAHFDTVTFFPLK
jgi:hypothetical protein